MAQEVLQFVNNKISEFGIEEKNVKNRYGHALRGFTAKLTNGQLEAIKQNPNVDFVEQNRKINFMLSSTSKLNSSEKTNVVANPYLITQTTPWGVTRVGGPIDGTNKIAWVLDTGIDLDHPDLNVDVTNSASFVAGESADDLNGHGTHVAGIVAAKNNSQKVVGVAANATVVAIKVLAQDPQNTEVSEIVDGVNYVASKASSNDVINMSLGAHDPSNLIQSVDLAVTNAANSGLRFTIAAGNSTSDAEDFTPARINHSNVWTVSAFRQGDEFVEVFDWNTPNCNPQQSTLVGSNFGNPPVDYAAPGENIKSLWKNGGTNTTCGTSMAAPHIAGLLLASPNDLHADGTVSNDPDSSPDEIVIYAPLNVDITGPGIRESGQQGTWTANAEFGSGGYTYQWYYRNDSSSPWQTGGTNSTFVHTFTNSGSIDVTAAVKVEVEDSSNNEVEDIHLVQVEAEEECTDPSCPGGS